MSSTIKVRRSSIERIFKKAPFRAWLDEQPRSALTYREDVPDTKGTGWRTEDFVREAWKRGVDLRIGTVNKWLANTCPRHMSIGPVRKAFPGIKFARESA